MKGDTVMFGEPITPSALRRSAEETANADLFMSVGTSAVVYPAARYRSWRSTRRPLIEVNPEDTPLTPLATVVLRGPRARCSRNCSRPCALRACRRAHRKRPLMLGTPRHYERPDRAHR
ncbi:MAG: Sir2 family NAD-dependent protein deacetylase [Dehalococcoidia bacterium]